MKKYDSLGLAGRADRARAERRPGGAGRLGSQFAIACGLMLIALWHSLAQFAPLEQRALALLRLRVSRQLAHAPTASSSGRVPPG